jgi:hypothetical protein
MAMLISTISKVFRQPKHNVLRCSYRSIVKMESINEVHRKLPKDNKYGFYIFPSNSFQHSEKIQQQANSLYHECCNNNELCHVPLIKLKRGVGRISIKNGTVSKVTPLQHGSESDKRSAQAITRLLNPERCGPELHRYVSNAISWMISYSRIESPTLSLNLRFQEEYEDIPVHTDEKIISNLLLPLSNPSHFESILEIYDHFETQSKFSLLNPSIKMPTNCPILIGNGVSHGISNGHRSLLTDKKKTVRARLSVGLIESN